MRSKFRNNKYLTNVRIIANLAFMARKVILYTTMDGKCPVRDFFDGLNGKVFRKIAWVLKLVSELDRIPSSYFKKLTGSDEIWECRVAYASTIYRLLCFFHNGSLVVLTNGFMKKTMKTPLEEIRKAEEYRKDFVRRKK